MTRPTSKRATPDRREARNVHRRNPGAARRARDHHARRTGQAMACTQAFMLGEAESS